MAPLTLQQMIKLDEAAEAEGEVSPVHYNAVKTRSHLANQQVKPDRACSPEEARQFLRSTVALPLDKAPGLVTAATPMSSPNNSPQLSPRTGCFDADRPRLRHKKKRVAPVSVPKASLSTRNKEPDSSVWTARTRRLDPLPFKDRYGFVSEVQRHVLTPMGSERDNCSTRPASPSTTISSRSHTPMSLAESVDSISSRISAPVVLPSRIHPPMAPIYSVKARSSPSLRQPVEHRMFRSLSTPVQSSTLGLDSSPESSQNERTHRPRRRRKVSAEVPSAEQRQAAEEHFARRVSQSLDYSYRRAFLSQKDQLQSYLQSSSLTSMERAVCLRKIGELYISTACLSDDGTGRKMAEIALSYFKHAVDKSEHRDPESCYLLGRTFEYLATKSDPADALQLKHTAVQWFEQALDISTDGNFQAYILTSLGVLLCSLGNVEGARDALEEAVRKDETQPNTWLNLANIWDDYYSQSGTEEEKRKAKYSAVLCYGRAYRLEPSALSISRLAALGVDMSSALAQAANEGERVSPTMTDDHGAETQSQAESLPFGGSISDRQSVFEDDTATCSEEDSERPFFTADSMPAGDPVETPIAAEASRPLEHVASDGESRFADDLGEEESPVPSTLLVSTPKDEVPRNEHDQTLSEEDSEATAVESPLHRDGAGLHKVELAPDQQETEPESDYGNQLTPRGLLHSMSFREGMRAADNGVLNRLTDAVERMTVQQGEILGAIRDLAAGQTGLGQQLQDTGNTIIERLDRLTHAQPSSSKSPVDLAGAFNNQLRALGSDRITQETAMQLQLIYAALAFQNGQGNGRGS